MPAASPQQVLREVLSAFDQHDWTIFDRHPGLHETRQRLPHLYAAFPDLRHTIQVELVEGALIGCVTVAQGTHRGPFMGIAPTGKQVSFMLLVIDRIEDNKVVEHWAIPDFMSLFQQLGMAGAFTNPAGASAAQHAA